MFQSLKMEYSLYSKLLQSSASFDPNDICSKINKLPKDHLEIIGSLIIHHYIITSKSSSKVIIGPRKIKKIYKGETNKDSQGILFTFSILPSEVQNVISSYVNLILS